MGWPINVAQAGRGRSRATRFGLCWRHCKAHRRMAHALGVCDYCRWLLMFRPQPFIGFCALTVYAPRIGRRRVGVGLDPRWGVDTSSVRFALPGRVEETPSA